MKCGGNNSNESCRTLDAAPIIDSMNEKTDEQNSFNETNPGAISEMKNESERMREPMEGVLIIDKPARLTSHDVVARVRRILRTKRVGHTGALDPFATGVLVILVGRATRLAQFLSGDEKEYLATVRFGYATTTGDLTGAPKNPNSEIERSEIRIPQSAMENALRELTGEIEQTPPMYSAKKIGGRKLYELARKGIEIERQPVKVFIREFVAVPPLQSDARQSSNEAKRSSNDGATVSPPLRHNSEGTCDMDARVICSAGVYVRTLAEDLGAKLGVGAHLAALRRTRAGSFGIERATTLEDLERAAAAGSLGSIILPMNEAVASLPFLHLTDGDARRVRNGAAIGVGELFETLEDGARVRLLDGRGALLGVGEYDAARRRVQPRVLLVAPEETT